MTSKSGSTPSAVRRLERWEWSEVVLGAALLGLAIRGALLGADLSLPSSESSLMLALMAAGAGTWAFLTREYVSEWKRGGVERVAIERAAAVSFVLAIAGSFLWSASSRLVVGWPSINGFQALIGLTLVFSGTEIVTRRRMS